MVVRSVPACCDKSREADSTCPAAAPVWAAADCTSPTLALTSGAAAVGQNRIPRIESQYPHGDMRPPGSQSQAFPDQGSELRLAMNEHQPVAECFNHCQTTINHCAGA